MGGRARRIGQRSRLENPITNILICISFNHGPGNCGFVDVPGSVGARTIGRWQIWTRTFDFSSITYYFLQSLLSIHK
jgi:hypothetical protein